jgi:phage FluMu protein Com
MGYYADLMVTEELNCSRRTVTCNYCNKKYMQTVQEQLAGFRDWEEDICPYCHEVNKTSMSEEYFNETIKQQD